MKQSVKTKIFKGILGKELELYMMKAADYGTEPVEETGIVGLFVRLHDKVHRVLNLSGDGMAIKVSDENLKDTLLDIANYANMCLVELITLEAKELVKRNLQR
jgi:hypothetical protein